MTCIAILGMGDMGASIAARLSGAGVRVLTVTQGRSRASQERARQAGVEAVEPQALSQASHVLSIVPPVKAEEVAHECAAAFASSSRKPAFLECNAVSVETSGRIAEVMRQAGWRYVDACIIGGPGQRESPGPAIYLSGEEPHDLELLLASRLRARSTGAPAGAASALKMAYAGFNKGLTGLAAAMVLAADRTGAGDALRAELADSAPHLLKHISGTLPDMYAKAWRWEFEMREVAHFAAHEPGAAGVYSGLADFFASLGHDWSADRQASRRIDGFLQRGEKRQP